MCGFLAQYNVNTTINCKEELEALLPLSKHRGPDETRFWSNDTQNAWFGFNRLAIQDLSQAGSQPMLSSSKRYCLVFNGEIYNHLELRKKLSVRHWNGHSDTETILACIEDWGFLKTIEQLDGMFALAVYDEVQNELYCARDFAGIKPFFYGWKNNQFVCASQYNQVRGHPEFQHTAIDPEVLRLYLEQHFVPAPFGLYKYTGQLEPGQWCKVSPKGFEKRFFWTFPDYQEADIRDEKAALKLIETSLNQSVYDEMIADVPLGAFLSGGIDSPLICHFAQQHLQTKLHTYCIGSDSEVHDEGSLAQKYASLIGTNHLLKQANTTDLIATFDEIMFIGQEPMADFSIIPTYWVSKLAKQQVTVALSGDGGDELFFGYERFASIAKNIHFQHYPYPIKALLYKGDQYLTHNKRVNSVLLANKQSKAHQALHNRFSDQWINNLFPDLQNIQLPDSYNTYNYANTRSIEDLIQKMRKAEFYGMMQKTLRKVDLASMGNSLEVRVPFLKKSFIETSLRIDPLLSFDLHKKKELLKKLLKQKYPTAPIDNVKRGFSVPFGDWLRNDSFMESVRNKYLNRLDKFGIQQPVLISMLNEQQKGKDLKWAIFTLINLNNA